MNLRVYIYIYRYPPRPAWPQGVCMPGSQSSKPFLPFNLGRVSLPLPLPWPQPGRLFVSGKVLPPLEIAKNVIVSQVQKRKCFRRFRVWRPQGSLKDPPRTPQGPPKPPQGPPRRPKAAPKVPEGSPMPSQGPPSTQNRTKPNGFSMFS